MSWYLNRTGQAEGPFQEHDIVQMIQGGQLREGHVCPVGGNNWVPLSGHPPFAQALTGGAGYGAPPAAGGYGAPPAGYGEPPAQQGYGAAPAAGGYGAAPAQGGYGAAPAQGGYGGAPAPGGYGAPPAAGGYGAAPGGYGAAPAAAGYGASPQPGYGAAPGAASGAAPAPAKAKGGKSMLVLGIVGGIGLVCVLAIALGYYFIARKPDADLAVSFPKDMQAYMEFPSLSHSLFAARGIKFIDSGKLDDKKQIDTAVSAFERAFELSKDDATSVVVGMESVAIGARNLGGPATEGVFVLEFRSRGAAEKLLASKRFTSTGTFAKKQKAYTLTARTLAFDKLMDLTPMERTLSEMRVDGKSNVLVWMEKPCILVGGTELLVKDMAAVLEDGKDSLDKSDVYKQAKKEFEGGSELVAFVDSTALKTIKGAEAQKIVNGYFHDVGPFVGSLKFVDAGMLVRVDGKLAGDKLPKDKGILADAAKIEVKDRLPDDTIGYIAYSSKLGVGGEKAKQTLLDELAALNEEQGRRMKADIASFETESGLSFATVLDAVGDDAAVAVVLARTFKLGNTVKADAVIKDGAIIFAQKVKDEGAAKKVVATFRTKVLEGPLANAYKVVPDGDGFRGEPRAEASGAFGLPVMQAKFVDKYLLVVVGSDVMVKHSVSAFETKKEVLGDDDSHNASIKPLPSNANLYLWVDTGRLTQMNLDANPKSGRDLESLGVPLSAIRLAGNPRLVTALSFDINNDNNLWTYNIDSVNAFALSSLAGMSGSIQSLAMSGLAAGGGAVTPPPMNPNDLIGVYECDDYVRRYQKCILKMPPSTQQVMARGLESTRQTWKTIAASRSRASLPSLCASAAKTLASNPACK